MLRWRGWRASEAGGGAELRRGATPRPTRILIAAPVTVYDRLTPLDPALTGDWRWVTYALIAAPLAVLLWTILGRRWRADGVRRCPRCSHAFDPGARFDAPGGVRCTECGAVTQSDRVALRRRWRVTVALCAVAAAFVLATPLMLWHSVHVFVARTLLPRWVTSQSATFEGGAQVVHEVDPVQRWLGFEPNPAPGAWHGHFEDMETDPANGPMAVWPGADRLEIRTAPGAVPQQRTVGRFAFGVGRADPESWALMPSIGSPGFGGDITGDGVGDIIVGEVNVGTSGGIDWWQVVPNASGSGQEIRQMGYGWFQRDEAHGDWVFLRRCTGFRYALTPGAYSQDPSVVCTWDTAARDWVPNAARMRRDPDRTRLAQLAREARTSYEDCERAAAKLRGPDPAQQPAADHEALIALHEGRAGLGDFLPCNQMVACFIGGVIELVSSGHGAEWEEWVRVSWPASDDFRDRFLADMRRVLDGCECAQFLRTLNGIPEPAPAVGSSPVRSTLREGAP